MSDNNPSILQLEEQSDTEDGKVMIDYESDIDYKLEGQDPNDESITQGEEEVNSDTEYAKRELPHAGT